MLLLKIAGRNSFQGEVPPPLTVTEKLIVLPALEEIDPATPLYDNLQPVKVDPAQIDQLLANLRVNARDAIAGVGKVIIETDASTFDE